MSTIASIASDGTFAISANDRLLTSGEVAGMFRVDPKTVVRWAKAGRLGFIRTPGGQRRYREGEIRALLREPGDPGV
ncbi:BldC family transcriptional regulator [Streptosporangium sp. NPDC051022]|uniref:BldC family transcriptional regulator n=1 Tax=Streptosporangium sp. NPDC051022 TaxID=3155752 RepID=UPI003432F609